MERGPRRRWSAAAGSWRRPPGGGGEDPGRRAHRRWLSGWGQRRPWSAGGGGGRGGGSDTRRCARGGGGTNRPTIEAMAAPAQVSGGACQWRPSSPGAHKKAGAARPRRCDREDGGGRTHKGGEGEAASGSKRCSQESSRGGTVQAPCQPATAQRPRTSRSAMAVTEVGPRAPDRAQVVSVAHERRSQGCL